MWVVRLIYPFSGRDCIVAAATREDAEKAAAEWNGWSPAGPPTVAGGSAQLNLSNMSLTHILHPHTKQRAERLTAQVQEEIALVRSILRDGLAAKYTREWPKDHSSYPEPTPAEPTRESYLPHLGFASRLVPSIGERKRAEAEGRFKEAHARWEVSKSKWERKKEDWLAKQARHNALVDEQGAAYRACDPEILTGVWQLALETSPYPRLAASIPEIALAEPSDSTSTPTEHPDTFPQTFELDYIRENRTVAVDYELPSREALPSVKAYRYVAAQQRLIPVPMARTQAEQLYESSLYQVALRTIYELFRFDEAGALDSVVFNGWVTSVDKATGQPVHPCVLTVQATRKEFLELNLAEVDPKACFRKLKGISGAKLAAMSPVRPILQISREDKRFITARPVIDALDGTTNLAAMDWEDFEQPIRDIFEKEFSREGGEVKITRASRDHGVDAVAFDPDAIRGGKIVIQAKRYTDTVSVSAVRDLYGTILNEGANKGILVTTADYGADAYEFAKGKPITLLSGSELLYLLQKHGRKARIDLAEARLLAAGEKRKAESQG